MNEYFSILSDTRTLLREMQFILERSELLEKATGILARLDAHLGDFGANAMTISAAECFEIFPDPYGRCWLYGGPLDKDGYGRFHAHRNVHLRVHRAAYEILVGPIPEGFVIDHLCCKPACYNPAHLEAVSPQENRRRGIIRIRSRPCKNGHPRTIENTWISKDGRFRQCRACNREKARRRRNG